TITDALFRAGAVVLSRSAKYRRPRGAYCLRGDCGSCMVRVDGRPNVRACTTPMHDGVRVERQNLHGPLKADPTALVDRLFPGGFDHHHFMVKPRVANEVMQAVARQLTGLGRVPDDDVRVHGQPLDLHPTVLVIGGGPAGLAVHATLTDADVDVLTVERGPRVDAPAGLHDRTAIFAAYPAESLFAAQRSGGRRTERDGAVFEEHLVRIHPTHVVFTMGTRAPLLPIANNDLPGVVAAAGIRETLTRTGGSLAPECVLIGDSPHARAHAEILGVDTVLTSDDVQRLERRGETLRVHTRDVHHDAPLVLLDPAPAPAHELAVMSGATVEFVERESPACAGFRVTRDARGWVGPMRGVREIQMWAAGGVCGVTEPEEAAEDGRAVARALLTALQDGAPEEEG
ncbi:MAG: 2Fe-2S iron-sulfur cluster-binding protein, partial [Nannocystaceae bacterium]